MVSNSKSQAEELVEVKAKLEMYERWHCLNGRNLESDHNHFPEDEIEIGLRDLWYIIWKSKFKILVMTALCAIASIYYALSLPNIYKSETLLVPNSQDTKSGISSLAGQIGGLASLAGVNLGSSNTDKTAYVIEVLKSRKFLYKFIKENELKPYIMAAKGWDKDSNSVLYDNSLYNKDLNLWTREVKPPFEAEPSFQETYKRFLKEHLTVTQDKQSGMVLLEVSHYSPHIAKEILDKLIEAINLTIKRQEMDEAIRSIQYLEEELVHTDISESRAVFYQLIEQQQQKLMLTKVRDDYVFKVVDDPVVAEVKSEPQRAIISVLGTSLGAMLFILLVLIRSIVRKID